MLAFMQILLVDLICGCAFDIVFVAVFFIF